MIGENNYERVLTPPARRALSEYLPETVAGVAIESLTTALVTQPRRVGTPLRDELPGIWIAGRGTYRVLYRVDEDARAVVVLTTEDRYPATRVAGTPV